jgi:hypothetical protein
MRCNKVFSTAKNKLKVIKMKNQNGSELAAVLTFSLVRTNKVPVYVHFIYFFKIAIEPFLEGFFSLGVYTNPEKLSIITRYVKKRM